jgi:hypothetical protein
MTAGAVRFGLLARLLAMLAAVPAPLAVAGRVALTAGVRAFHDSVSLPVRIEHGSYHPSAHPGTVSALPIRWCIQTTHGGETTIGAVKA